MTNKLQIIEVDRDELAGRLGVTVQRVSQLASDDRIVKLARGRYDLWGSLSKYIAFLRAGATANGIDGSPFEEQALADLRFSRARAEIYEAKAALMSGRAFDADAVIAVGSEMMAAFRARCLAIPTKLAPRIQLAGVDDLNAIQALLKEAIYEALNEISNFDPRPIIERFHAEDRESGNGADADEQSPAGAANLHEPAHQKS